MSYRNTILHRPGEKYPFLLATEADGIPLTRGELETLQAEIDVALMEDDDFDPKSFDATEMEEMRRQYDAEHMGMSCYASRDDYDAAQADLPAHKRDGWAERMYEQADMRRQQLREEGK